MTDLIRMDNLIFDYPGDGMSDEVRALDGIDLDIEEGSFVAVIGRNGSGKSTLAKMINALLVPTKGNVTVNGFNTKDEEHIWDVRQTAAMVFQNPDNQIVSSIVEDDVAFGPENLGIEADVIRERVDRSLAAVRMGEYKKKAPHMLSGGQKQRIAIAGAIAMRPKCIVFDEPTAMLDPTGRQEVLRIINGLHEEGITCVLITHFMDEAAQAERIVIMNKGRIDMDGKPSEIFSRRERLRELSLDVPLSVELAWRLKSRGIDLPADISSEKELVEAICRLK
ncbi:MAG: energy-coupling factor transporter ATPase [Eubacteriaceae bacterium]|nr:energy-coupling factor transporter ATPase [Eubacteriaceae bacterium]